MKTAVGILVLLNYRASIKGSTKRVQWVPRPLAVASMLGSPSKKTEKVGDKHAEFFAIFGPSPRPSLPSILPLRFRPSLLDVAVNVEAMNVEAMNVEAMIVEAMNVES